MKRFLRAVVLQTAALIVAVAGAHAPARAALVTQTTYNGAKIVEQRDPSSSLIGVQLFVPAGLDRQTAAQSGIAALVAESIAGTPVGRDRLPLRDALQGEGGAVSYSVDGRWIRFYVEGIKANFGSRLLPLFEAAISHPAFDETSLQRARRELGRKIAENQSVPLTVALEMLNAAFFTASEAGLPPFGLPATLQSLSSQDVQTFFSTYYRRSGAIVSAAGDLDAARSDDFTKIVDTLPAGATRPVPVTLPKLRGAQRRLVARRDIAVPWLVAQFPAPSLRSRDFGAMLVLTTFLERTASEMAGNPTITTLPFSDRPAGAMYNFDQQPANVVLYVNGGFGDPTRPFSTALSVVQIFAHSKLSGDIGTMKSIAIGTFVDAAATLEDRSWFAGVFAEQDASPDFVARGLDAIKRVRAADLQRVARVYLGNPNVALVLPRAGSDTSS